MRVFGTAFGVYCKFLSSLCAFVLGLSLAAPSASAEGPRRIFLLEGLTPTQPAAVQTIEAFKQRLVERKAGDVEVYTDYLDRGRFRGPEADQRMVQFLNAKFAKAPPDLIVPISRGATEFMARYRDQIVPKVPVVYCCTPTSTTDPLDVRPDMPGIVVEYDWVGTLALAERLQPNAKTLVIVSGSAEVDRAWQQDAVRSLQRYLKKYETKLLVTYNHGEVVDELSRLPRDAIVILMPIFGDPGRSSNPSTNAAELARASSAPSYSPVATLFGGGIIGGHMDSYIGQATKVADMALDVLAGKDPATFPHQTKFPLQTRVDARQLERWGFPAAALPRGTSLEFQRPALWDQYRNIVLLVLLAFVVQVGVIALLLLQKHKRQAAEKLLKESEDRMAFSAASTNTGIWRLDVASGRLWATAHCRRMFGIAPDVPLTWALFHDAVHPDDYQTFAEWVQSVATTDHPMAVEFRIALPNETPRCYACQHYTVSDGDGKPVQVSGIFIDVTARKNAEAQAELQQKELTHIMRVAALGELSGGIAHELSQPLAAILANAQAAQAMLAGRNYNKNEIAEILEDIVQEDSRAGQVIHRLRRLLKKGDHQSAVISFNDLIKSTLGLLHSELMNRKVKIETNLQTNLPLISGDSVQLQQVLLNLMINAMEAMASTPPSRRMITIGTRTTAEGCVEVSITDHGHGMSPENLKRVFEPFFTTKERGLGLGLSICSTIVQSHRGRLNLTNTSGGGMIATVSVPIGVQLAAAS